MTRVEDSWTRKLRGTVPEDVTSVCVRGVTPTGGPGVAETSHPVCVHGVSVGGAPGDTTDTSNPRSRVFPGATSEVACPTRPKTGVLGLGSSLLLLPGPGGKTLLQDTSCQLYTLPFVVMTPRTPGVIVVTTGKRHCICEGTKDSRVDYPGESGRIFIDIIIRDLVTKGHLTTTTNSFDPPDRNTEYGH